MLGIDISERSVSGLLSRRNPKPPSQTWKTFIKNHLTEMVAVDFIVVPTIRFRLLFVFVVLSHVRRQVIHFNVTEHPTAEWTAQQIIEAFPWDTAPKYLLRDRDSIYGDWFRRRVKSMGIEEVLTAYRSPWQNAYVERLNGSIRRECTDHVIVFGENHLRELLRGYFAYYHEDRTHLGLDKETPMGRPVSNRASPSARLVELPRVGGLHHRNECINCSIHLFSFPRSISSKSPINRGHRSTRTFPLRKANAQVHGTSTDPRRYRHTRPILACSKIAAYQLHGNRVAAGSKT